MATPRPKDVNCLVPPSAKQAKICNFLLKVSLASFKIQGKDPLQDLPSCYISHAVSSLASLLSSVVK